jgi:hypothetical protein
MATSFSDALASAASAASAIDQGSYGINSSLSSFASSLTTSSLAVGAAWMVSSSIFTTYSTTKFIRVANQHTAHPASWSALQRKGQDINELSRRRPFRRFLTVISQRLPPANLLTMYRFAGSLLLGICCHPDVGGATRRLQSTLAAVPALAIPAGFLFIANFCNS